MASNPAVVAALTMLARAFAGTVDREKIEVYGAAWDDLTDGDLSVATAKVIKSHTGEFIPPPAVVREACAVVLDVERVVAELDKLAVEDDRGEPTFYHLPGPKRVRERLGDAIANASTDIGVSRLFADDPTTRAIAIQEFRKVLRSEAAWNPHSLPAWAARSRLAATQPSLLVGDEQRLLASARS